MSPLYRKGAGKGMSVGDRAGRDIPDRPDNDLRAAVWDEGAILGPLTFAGCCGRAQLDPAQDLTQDDPHLDHGEPGAETASVASAEREPGGRTEGGAEH